MSRHPNTDLAGRSGLRLVPLKVRHNARNQTIYLNPEDVSRLIERDDWTLVVLRSEVGSRYGYPGVLEVSEPLERVAARLTGGSGQS